LETVCPTSDLQFPTSNPFAKNLRPEYNWARRSERSCPLERKRVLICSIICIVVATLLACDTGTFTAFLDSGAATPTRTPRPTFTPRATASPTPEDTETPEATPTTAATRTSTPRVVATARPATKVPTAPPAPPQVQLFHREPGQGLCTTGAPVFEVKGRIKIGTAWAAGIHVIAIDKSGKIIAQTNSWGEEQLNPEWGVSCWQEKNLYNYQMDVTAGWYNGPLTLRLTQSATDLTSISTDEKLTFDASGGRYYIDWIK
jgi:hypothetical protein